MRSIGRAAALVVVVGMPVVAYALAATAFALWEGLGSSSAADAGTALEDGLALLAAASGTVIAAYLGLTGYAMLLGAAWRGGRAIPKTLVAIAPRGWTRVTAIALGLTMSAGLATPALAADADSTPGLSAGWVAAPAAVVVEPTPGAVVIDADAVAVGWVAAESTAARANSSPTGEQSGTLLLDAPALAGSPLQAESVQADPLQAESLQAGAVDAATFEPTAPEGGSATSTPVTPTPAASTSPPSGTHMVQAGESLWLITEELLGDDAGTAEVAATWPELYEANRASIGDNPSLIHPGVALTIPAGLGA